MNVTLSLPGEIAARFGATGVDLERCALEALALDEFRLERLIRLEVKQVLGFADTGPLHYLMLTGDAKARGL
jgi:hypothetical protein